MKPAGKGEQTGALLDGFDLMLDGSLEHEELPHSNSLCTVAGSKDHRARQDVQDQGAREGAR
jgi:hypothetical protein